MATKTLKWGLYLGLALVVVTQILTWFGLGTTGWYIGLTYLLVVLTAFYFAKSIWDQPKASSTLLIGIVYFALVVIISRYIFQAYMYIYIHYIDPTWIDTVAQTWKTMMIEQEMSQDLIDQQIEGFRLSYKTIPMFTSEIISIGLSQFVLGSIVMGGYYWWSKKKRNSKPSHQLPV